eukprot:TRINITY_DN26797_c0_g1_i1.p1 TRINITY_DN26797_c0_g1~~TRINITY_DN26797_c0_g1_i1.p1  ORF type:complete len:291 (-),score=17.52 TRINITY_DN26797_c0_g1_i1:18-890(-)
MGNVVRTIVHCDVCDVIQDYQLHLGSHGIILFDLFLSIPLIAFLIYLLYNLSSSLQKLRESDSLIMSTYYTFIWIVLLFDFIRIIVSLIEPNAPIKQFYDIFYLIFYFLLIFIELSIIVFMSHSFTITGREALFRTVWITAVFASLYSIVQVILVYPLHIDIFQGKTQASHLYWFISSTVLLLVYVGILVVPRISKFFPHLERNFNFANKNQLYYYVLFLMVLYGSRALGSFIAFMDMEIGFCFIVFQKTMYYAVFLPLLYWTFLWEFFRVPSLHVYHEMVMRGYWDADT